ncbi:AMP-binding enzyme [Microbacterium sp. NIBRBAC000506063]|uniref:AMP-binding enzyme n=1 Tax=Microbacterium sp. NIBRBAC000506063 TaxID=2734618 RepID=UPI0021D3FC26|nr:hypothetical protein [Microbacterium sp. NIBRBAC000506063]
MCAFLVLTDDAKPGDDLRAELKDFVKTQIAPYKYPREIHFVSTLPRNPSGKLQRFRLAEQFEAAPAARGGH